MNIFILKKKLEILEKKQETKLTKNIFHLIFTLNFKLKQQEKNLDTID